MITVVFAPWNDGTYASRVARARVDAWIANGDKIVLLGPKKFLWVEDNHMAPEESFHYHEIGESVQTSEGDLIDPPAGVDAADQAVFQLIFYARVYGADRVYVFGGLTSVLETLARIKLVEDFTTPVRVELVEDFLDISSSAPEALEVVVRDILSRAEAIESPHVNVGLPTTLVPLADIHMDHTSLARARAALPDKMGMNIPTGSRVFLCVNPTRDTVLNVVRAFENARRKDARFAEGDNTLLWIQQDTTDIELARAIAANMAGNWILYTRVPLPTDVFACLLDACDFGVHCGSTTELHVHRKQIACDTDIVHMDIGKLTASVRVPNVDSLSAAMIRAYMSA